MSNTLRILCWRPLHVVQWECVLLEGVISLGSHDLTNEGAVVLMQFTAAVSFSSLTLSLYYQLFGGHTHSRLPY